ncbi:glycosyltransferase, partial [Enterococcus faecalis]
MISVCIASYNGEKYLAEQLDSILLQVCEDVELIISDDGSTDLTLEILRT